jgi:hypothetical protein
MNPHPIFASLTTAAALLDLTPGEFRALRAMHLLPAPHVIGGLERYFVPDLVEAVREKR